MSEYLIQGETLEDIADAIRAKTGNSELINPEDMPDEIASIIGELPTGMTNIGSGSFTFASKTALNTTINHGLNFTPKCVIIWTNAELSSDLFHCLLTRQLANNTGTYKSTRYIVIKVSGDTGLEVLRYESTYADDFITSTIFNVGHGSRFYAAGVTYNWFAFA